MKRRCSVTKKDVVGCKSCRARTAVGNWKGSCNASGKADVGDGVVAGVDRLVRDRVCACRSQDVSGGDDV